MLFDGVPFLDLLKRKRTFSDEALAALTRVVEKKSGGRLLFDAGQFPLNDPSLAEPELIARALRERGVLLSCSLSERLPDEPPTKAWRAQCSGERRQQVGGASWTSHEDALYATLAEALERFIWTERTEHFESPVRANVAAMRSEKRAMLAPERFVSFSSAHRNADRRKQLRDDASYQWIRARSLVSGNALFIPAQVASGVKLDHDEPLIRDRNTNGLATFPTKDGAELAGMLELIERDAYLILWLNRLSAPRIALEALRAREPKIDAVLRTLARYRMRLHAVQMPTDAPTHAILAVIEDETGHAPRFSVGLKAHRDLSRAVEKAALEALRARSGVRRAPSVAGAEQRETPVDRIGHRERLYYWADPAHADELSFLIEGAEVEVNGAVWESDSESEHRARILAWCKARSYECVSVSLTHSPWNPTPWHIAMIVMPDLHHLWLTEPNRQLAGDRWRSVPPLFDLPVRSEPYLDGPHPFS